MPEMPLYLGVDVGGTKTHVVIADGSGCIRGAAQAGPANWEMVGLEGTYRVLAQTLQAATAGAGITPAGLCAAGYGLAGLDWPSDETRLEPVVQRLGVPGPNVLVNDAFIALYAGSGEGYGVAIIAGTGATVAGRNRRGETFRSFGRNREWGDFGSARDIVNLATMAMVHAHLGRGQPSLLTGRFLEIYEAQDLPELVEWISRGQVERPDGRLAPVVFEAAEAGDGVAQAIIRQAGRELGQNALAVARQLGLTSEAFPLVLAGGVFRSGSEVLRQAVLEPFWSEAPAVQPVDLQAPPVAGSIFMAMQAAGQEVTPQVRQRLLAEAQARVELHAPIISGEKL